MEKGVDVMTHISEADADKQNPDICSAQLLKRQYLATPPLFVGGQNRIDQADRDK
jgi:hypothetical protein